MGRKINREEVYFAFNQGGLGDFIARLTVIKYVLNNYRHVDLKVIAQDYQIPLLKHVFPKLFVRSFARFNSVKRQFPVNVIKADIPEHTIIRCNLVDQAFNTLIDYHPFGNEHRNYVKIDTTNIDISRFNLPEKYVVIPLMFTAKVREFSPHIVHKIIKHVNSKGYAAVFLGCDKAKANDKFTITAETTVNRAKGIDLINQTTLLEASKIMEKSKCVITLDSGLGHLAACTDVPIIIGYTTVEPHHRTPQRHNQEGWKIKSIIPPKHLSCRFCQSKLNFVYRHDFRKCFYDHMKCIKQAKVEPYILAFNDVLNNNWEKKIYEQQ